MKAIKFRDFAALKSGYDRFSRIRLPELRNLVGVKVVEVVEAKLEREDQQAACYRWCLRRLHTDEAIRKVKTDAEIAENAISANVKKRGQRHPR